MNFIKIAIIVPHEYSGVLFTSLRALTLNFLTKTHSICVQSTRMGKMHQENKKILMLGKIWVLPLFFSFLVHHASSAREEATEASKRCVLKTFRECLKKKKYKLQKKK